MADIDESKLNVWALIGVPATAQGVSKVTLYAIVRPPPPPPRARVAINYQRTRT